MNSLVEYIFGVKIEISTACNANCIMCPKIIQKINRPKFMDLDVYKKIIDELELEYGKLDLVNREKTFNQIIYQLKKSNSIFLKYFTNFLIDSVKDGKIVLKLYGYGEPLMNPKFFEMIKYLKNKCFHPVLSTNGSFIMTKKFNDVLMLNVINEIYVSVDSHIKEDFEKIRKGLNFNLIMNNILYLKEQIKNSKLKTKLNIQIVKLPYNEKTCNKTVDFFLNSGIDAGIIEDMYTRKRLNGLICPFIQHTLFIYTNGDIQKCCLDPIGETKIGNINKMSLRDVWFSEKNLLFLILNQTKNIKEINICKKYCIDDSKLVKKF